MNKRQRKKKFKKMVNARVRSKLYKFVNVRLIDDTIAFMAKVVEDELHKIFHERYQKAEMVTLTGVIGK